ncbi:type II toxin-antitoxin system RelE/ParE family toxin [Lacipirellula sp.]|uniref:type II toxin-antitoxin system RelE/ParE family toxin n=1 Tax=Lacipirellula sp. TaxID=2691419 RepID=UPI003D0BCA5F
MSHVRVEFDPEAIAEAQEAYRWYAKRSQRAADGFIAELDAAVARISKQPQLLVGYLHGTRRCLLKRYPYAVVYNEQPELIQVVAVAHCKRRPGYWKGRVG